MPESGAAAEADRSAAKTGGSRSAVAANGGAAGPGSPVAGTNAGAETQPDAGTPRHIEKPRDAEKPRHIETPGNAGTQRGTGAHHDAGASRIARQVAEFHRRYELPVADRPTARVPTDQVTLRQDLIDEEVSELRDASAAGDLVAVADALADIVYVAYGTACVYGIDLDAVLDEVHASNMTKLGADGRPVRRADGKVMKGPDYRPPDVAGVLGRRA